MTDETSAGKRYASTKSFDRYLDSGVAIVLPVPGTPKTFIFVDPLKPELGLRVEVGKGSEAPETGLRNVTARIASREGGHFLEVVVTVPTLFRGAYPFLCSMADRVQLDGHSPAKALQTTLDNMASLLRTPDSMTREREVGLFGELLVLGGFISRLGASKAVQAWRGGRSEEHDFGLPGFDLEVKTTSSEHRIHWIESLTQLVPSLDRPLWLVSHQVTSAGTGHGASLPDLVKTTRLKIGSGPAREGLERGLAGAGWTDESSDQLGNRWTRRAESRAYPVVGSFPSLTPDIILKSGLPLDRFREVHYRVDLDGWESQLAVPEIIATTIKFKGWK